MNKQKGFTLVEIMIVVAIIAILAAIAIPQLLESRKMAAQNKCMNSLKVLDYSKEQAALNLGLGSGATVATASTVAFTKGGIPTCPRSGTYTYNTQGVAGSCSIHGTLASPTALSLLTTNE